jgi:hypothetical protein
MNAETGQVYDLGTDVFGEHDVGQMFDKAELDAAMAKADRALTADEMAAAVDIARGDPVVRVGEEAAQRARLGDRELRRRRQRRR